MTQGFWDREGGWAARLRKFLDAKSLLPGHHYFFSVFNLGVSGDTSKDLLERFEFETKMRLNELDKGEEVIFIISIGSNDSIYNQKTKKHWVSLPEFEKNLKKMFALAKKYGNKTIFVGDTPVDGALTNPIPWVKNCSYLNKFIEQYNRTAEMLCKKEKVYFIEIYSKLSNIDYKSLLEDGVHLNTKGHELLFEEVKEYLLKNKLL